VAAVEAASATINKQGTLLGFCSLHSHCDSFFQQSDQLSETPAARCHRKNVL